MSVGSPSALLSWAVLSCTFQVFLLYHLWLYDRFKCLRWNAGRQPGAFKRVMTYSYLITVPLLVAFSVGTTTLKYREGYAMTPAGIIPKPLDLWDQNNRRWILPLTTLLAVAWTSELITHLEELTFWLFLLHQGPSKRAWFHSWEFRVWYFGSIVALVGMPATVITHRQDPALCQAWIFIAGASAGAATTIASVHVLARFPKFIRRVKTEGAELDVVVRLTTFYHFNVVRVAFRFLFNFPLLLIGVDGVQTTHSIVSNPFAIDFLLLVGGTGCFISSAITLLIFFPRSLVQESGYHTIVQADRQNQRRRKRTHRKLTDGATTLPLSASEHYVSSPSTQSLPWPVAAVRRQLKKKSSYYFRRSQPLRAYTSDIEGFRNDSDDESDAGVGIPLSAPQSKSMVNLHHSNNDTRPRPPSWHDSEGTIGRKGPDTTAVHPYVMTFTSPIDLLDPTPSAEGDIDDVPPGAP